MSRAEISTLIDGDVAVRTIGLGQRAMAEDEGGRERSQGPAGGGAGDGEHGSPAAVAHGGDGAGVAETAAARQGRSYEVRAELRCGATLCGSPEEKEKAGRGGELRCAAMARFPTS
jgi:hypothetical protein